MLDVKFGSNENKKSRRSESKTFTVVTHSGRFHPDEIFAIALLKKYFGNVDNIIRTRDLEILENALNDESTILVDVGLFDDPSRLAFDHHQGTLDKFWTAEDGMATPYSATGLVFDFLSKNGYMDVDKNGLDFIKREWVVPIDAADNGVMPCEKLAVVFGFNRDENNDEQFIKALDLVENVLENIIYRAKQYSISVQDTINSVKEAHIVKVDGNYFTIVDYTNKNIDVKFAMKINPNIDFFIAERDNGVFGVKTAPLTIENMFSIKNKVPSHFIKLKDDGKQEELDKFALNGTVDFIHKSGFFSVVSGNFEDAKEFALSVIKHKDVKVPNVLFTYIGEPSALENAKQKLIKKLGINLKLKADNTFEAFVEDRELPLMPNDSEWKSIESSYAEIVPPKTNLNNAKSKIEKATK
jgi:uncharacterized UPF0160 family protein